VSFDARRLGQLRQAMTAWTGARSLSDAAFRARFLDPSTSGAAVGKLRAAAEGVSGATTQKDLAAASADLAGAMQSVGLEKWPGFLKDAAERAQGGTKLAQAVTPNTATDAGSDGGAAAPPGRYVAENPRQWIGRPSVGDGECVPLARAATGAPPAVEWRPGVAVQGNTKIRPGTLIATFDANGHYTGHAAIYLGQDEHGIQAIDQWNNVVNGRIESQHQPSQRTISF
jgi:hypothetical protein